MCHISKTVLAYQFFSLHFTRLRNIHILLKGLNKPQEKEAGLEIKWDANRDPLQKFVFYVKYDHPEFMNYSGNFQVSFPGRTVNGGLVFAAKGKLLLIDINLIYYL